jgi:hypothetical protein
MARGWESKSVEEQQSVASQPVEGNRSAADRERENQKRSLELQISRVEAQLAEAKDDRHKKILDAALSDLRDRRDKISNL